MTHSVEKYNILIQFGTPVKTVSLIKLHLKEAYINVRKRKNLSDASPIQNGLKKGDALPPPLFNFRMCHSECPRISGLIGTEWNISAPGQCR